MGKYLIDVYDLIVTVVPIILIIIFSKKHRAIFKNKKDLLLVAIFIFYICLLFHLTGTGTVYNLKMYGIDLSKTNFLPFLGNVDRTIYIMNLIGFIPFGILIPTIWNKNATYTIFSGFLISLLIEMSQLFNNRITDIDDLILNTLGVFFGYLIYNKFIKKIYGKDKTTITIISPLIIVIVVLLSRMFLFNELAIAKYIYKF